ncbi:hypothetical protein MYU51_001793 [Penicillium brevicompactum]|uniref:uncharacterized protein n=1 Tax=Penicillium brevicompactum TaxID=5074 RepID=UPI00254101DC|nr:uncharacterized protein N7506_009823 [Penicillium brevicompactum]KAJ5326721.1 hypothetical protein N7506_009823 [Penicillium brevicompactum]
MPPSSKSSKSHSPDLCEELGYKRSDINYHLNLHRNTLRDAPAGPARLPDHIQAAILENLSQLIKQRGSEYGKRAAANQLLLQPFGLMSP